MRTWNQEARVSEDEEKRTEESSTDMQCRDDAFEMPFAPSHDEQLSAQIHVYLHPLEGQNPAARHPRRVVKATTPKNARPP